MKIYLPMRICSDLIYISGAYADSGIYEAHMNQNGAVSVKCKSGTLLGVKLDEFLFLTKKDRDDWIDIAHPNIPKVKTEDD